MDQGVKEPHVAGGGGYEEYMSGNASAEAAGLG